MRRCRDMGIGVQREAGGEVPQHAGHRLDIHAVLQGNGCEGVAEIVESDLWNTSPFEDTLQHIVDAVRGDGTAVRGGKHIDIIGFAFLFFQNFYCLL